MIESGIVPTDSVMARGAIRRRERAACSGVGRIIGLLPGGQVTARIPAIGRSNIQAVVVVDVTESAAWNLAAISDEGVRVGQRKAKRIVVEFSVGPLGDGMASGTSGRGRREAGADVIGNGTAKRWRAIPGRQMAPNTISRIQGVVVADVASGARRGRRRHVCAGKRETSEAVIKRRSVPTLGGVAVGTICGREGGPSRGVHGIIRLLPGGQVAAGVAAIRGRNLQVVVVVDMAGGTGNIGVAEGQRESGSIVIKIDP